MCEKKQAEEHKQRLLLITGPTNSLDCADPDFARKVKALQQEQ